MAGLLQLLPERQEVLDDPVVHDDEFTRRIRVRVSVDVAWLTVGGPPGVPDPDRPPDRPRFEQRCQPIDLSLGLANLDLAVGDGDAGRVVAAILETTETVEKHRRGLLRAYIAHDSAHERTSVL